MSSIAEQIALLRQSIKDAQSRIRELQIEEDEKSDKQKISILSIADKIDYLLGRTPSLKDQYVINTNGIKYPNITSEEISNYGIRNFKLWFACTGWYMDNTSLGGLQRLFITTTDSWVRQERLTINQDSKKGYVDNRWYYNSSFNNTDPSDTNNTNLHQTKNTAGFDKIRNSETNNYDFLVSYGFVPVLRTNEKKI